MSTGTNEAAERAIRLWLLRQRAEQANVGGSAKSPAPVEGSNPNRSSTHNPHQVSLITLMIAALGVVYGDIGTSPLYAFNESRNKVIEHSEAFLASDAIGIASLMIWSLISLVTAKYVMNVLKADHHGEGGMFAFLAQLGFSPSNGQPRIMLWLAPLLIFASCLLYGDGVITPAISVLSAVEGLVVLNPSLQTFVIPLTLVILTGLFVVQYKGTAKVGAVFGACTAIWFLAIAAVGVYQIAHHPEVILGALNPFNGLTFLWHHGWHGSILILGSVVLTVTGCEALWADLGHFGAKAIRITWLWFVFPALALNYAGQAAFLFSGEEVISGNVFYSAVPGETLRMLMVPLATMATIIASQALISGAFSLTTQAMALGLFPRVKVVHTSSDMEGQTYLPSINWALWAGCCALVVGFKSSSALASAYGLAVTAVMVITAVTMMVVSRSRWQWSWLKIGLVWGAFMAIDLAYFGANVVKFMDGGYFPVIIALVLLIIMTTWRWGRVTLREYYKGLNSMTMEQFLGEWQAVTYENFAVVVMSSIPVRELSDRIPAHLQVLWSRYNREIAPRHITIVNVRQGNQPFVVEADRAQVYTFHEGDRTIVSVVLNYGYMEEPQVRAELLKLKEAGQIKIPVDPAKWIVWVGRENLHELVRGLFHDLQFRLFRMLLWNATPAHEYMGLDDDGVEGIDIHPKI